LFHAAVILLDGIIAVFARTVLYLEVSEMSARGLSEEGLGASAKLHLRP